MSRTAEKTADGTRVSPRLAVIQHVRGLLRQGEVRPGEIIPSERSLSRELGVHRATVRRALGVLEEEGLFRIRGNGERVVLNEASLSRSAVQSMVAVFMPDVVNRMNEPQWHTQSGWAEVMGQSAIRALRRDGRGAMMLPSQEADESLFTQFKVAPPAGLIVANLDQKPELLDELARRSGELPCPVVVYGGHPRWQSFDRVVSDHASGAYVLHRYLQERGRQRILLLTRKATSATKYWIDQRVAGYRKAVAESATNYCRIVEVSDPGERDWVPEDFPKSVQNSLWYLAEHLTGPEAADAVMCMSDGLVFQIAAAARKLHRSPGEDIDVVGYDNYWRDVRERRYESYVPPATVDKRNQIIGQMMVELLLQRINGDLDSQPQVRVVEPELVKTSDEAPV
jgi:DNA-binding LacI/PurR family transcriptional regulator